MSRIEKFGNATLYLGDCREILPTLDRFNGCITDPPYGINLGYDIYNDTIDAWHELMLWLVPSLKEKCDVVIMPSCQIKELGWIYTNIPPDWIICWYKGSPGHRSHAGFNDWEPHLMYGKRKGTQFHDYFYAQPSEINLNVDHPCPKSIMWARKLINMSTLKNDTIIDPFMGTGTTGISSLMEGRQFTGIEMSPKYFDISCRRIEEASKQGGLF